jgi:hypothetical protein
LSSSLNFKKEENNICEKWKGIMKHYNCYFNVEDESLLDNELIDAVIKYIDLSDKTLRREGLPQLTKDEENNEIKYCVRSILKNIPWINKIFIIMPNEKVKYFKDYNEIKEKIIYVKDKDLIGFDSASSTVFEFNLWRLKYFGISKNFIYFNDDTFIGNPLKKSDFFYIENDTIVPYIFGYKLNEPISKEIIEKYHKPAYEQISQRKFFIQDPLEYLVHLNNTRLFIYQLFGNSARIISNNHNALPDNIIESEEIYNLILNQYDKANASLKALIRGKDQLVFQEFRINYILNKYNRKLRELNSKHYDLTQRVFKSDLFTVNKGGGVTYEYYTYGKSLIFLNEIFPTPTKYENITYKSGYYILKSILNKNMVVHLDNDYINNRSNLYLNPNKNQYAEVFDIEYDNDNSYTIKSISNGKYLGISKGRKLSLRFTKNVIGNNQKWYFLTNKKIYYYIVSKDHSKCSLSIFYNHRLKYNQIFCFPPTGKRNQLFKFLKVRLEPINKNKS